MAKPTWSIEGTTKVVGVIGDPVAHSLSPRMHNAAFKALGLDYVYVALNPSKKDIAGVVASIRHLGLVGLNVTIPFKEDVMAHCDRLTPAARAIGAVNTIYLDGRKLIGNNTDAPGFTAALAAHGFRARNKRVLVIGAGGSSRAVVHALVEAGAAEIVIANRTKRKASRLATEFSTEDVEIEAAGLDALTDEDFLATRRLVVNTTSVGLKGGSFLKYAAASTADGCMHFDLAYGEKATPFIAAATKAGRPTIDGRHMLVHQGALAFKLFTGRRPPVDVMLGSVGV